MPVPNRCQLSAVPKQEQILLDSGQRAVTPCSTKVNWPSEAGLVTVNRTPPRPGRSGDGLGEHSSTFDETDYGVLLLAVSCGGLDSTQDLSLFHIESPKFHYLFKKFHYFFNKWQPTHQQSHEPTSLWLLSGSRPRFI